MHLPFTAPLFLLTTLNKPPFFAALLAFYIYIYPVQSPILTRTSDGSAITPRATHFAEAAPMPLLLSHSDLLDRPLCSPHHLVGIGAQPFRPPLATSSVSHAAVALLLGLRPSHLRR